MSQNPLEFEIKIRDFKIKHKRQEFRTPYECLIERRVETSQIVKTRNVYLTVFPGLTESHLIIDRGTDSSMVVTQKRRSDLRVEGRPKLTETSHSFLYSHMY